MAFDSVHDNDKHGQAAWLQEILKSTNETEVSQLLSNIYADVSEEISFKFNCNDDLKSFILLTFEFYKNKLNLESDANLAKFCCEQMKLPFNENKTPKDMYHALNMHLSSKIIRMNIFPLVRSLKQFPNMRKQISRLNGIYVYLQPVT